MCRSPDLFLSVGMRNAPVAVRALPHDAVLIVRAFASLIKALQRGEDEEAPRLPAGVLQTDTTCQTLHLAARLTFIRALPLLPRSSRLSLKTTSDKHLISTLNIAIIKSPPVTWSLFIIPLPSSLRPATVNLSSPSTLSSPPSLSPQRSDSPSGSAFVSWH